MMEDDFIEGKTCIVRLGSTVEIWGDVNEVLSKLDVSTKDIWVWVGESFLEYDSWKSSIEDSFSDLPGDLE